MKKILMISLEFPPMVGGIASYVKALGDALKSQVTLLVPPHKEAASGDARRQYHVIRRPFLWPKIVWPRWTRLLWHTLRARKKIQADMIYVHHILPEGTVAYVVKLVTRTPFVIFSHGTDVAMCAATPWKRKLVSRIGRASEQIVVNSDSLKGRLLERFPEFKEKITVVYPCPDQFFLDRPNPESVNALRASLALEGKKVILSVGRLIDGKGFPHLLRMMPEIVRRVPNAVWLVIGDGPKRPVFLRFVEEKRLAGAVRYLGSIPHAELPIYYGLADTFALLTHPDNGLEEGLGLVFLEAAAAGVPSVAGRSGGVPEAVIHGETGFVVDTFQEKQVIEAIVAFLTNPGFAKDMGQVARERIQADFQTEHQIARLDPWR